MTSVVIPGSVTNIGDRAFFPCFNLRDITVDDSSLNYSSIDGVLLTKNHGILIRCPTVRVGSYTIPDGVMSVQGYAFDYCSSLTSVRICSSVTNIGFYNGIFNFCTNLTAITVDPLSLFYTSVDGVLLDKAQTTLVRFPEGSGGDYSVPSGVTLIQSRAFAHCGRLISITLPSTVTVLGTYAFDSCINLAGVYFL